MIISLHLPKTGGTSFGKMLEAHFGNAFYFDYGDLPLNTPRWRRKLKAVSACLWNRMRRFEGTDCVHGHFLPVKYWSAGLRANATFVTWIRNPVDQLVSMYEFWQRTRGPKLPPLHRRVLQDDWSLERFCLGPELQNNLTQLLWRFPISRFAFVGVFEFFEEDCREFARAFLDCSTPAFRENVNPNGGSPRRIDSALRAKIESHHQLDMELHAKSIQMRPLGPPVVA